MAFHHLTAGTACWDRRYHPAFRTSSWAGAEVVVARDAHAGARPTNRAYCATCNNKWGQERNDQ